MVNIRDAFKDRKPHSRVFGRMVWLGQIFKERFAEERKIISDSVDNGLKYRIGNL